MLPPTLTGTHVHLEPLHESHAAELADGADAEMFRYFPPPYAPAGVSVSDMAEYIRTRTGGAIAFAIIERASGRAVGSSCFLDIRDAHRGVEIGATFILPAWRRTKVNPESKLLMLTHAFDHMRCIRVQLKCDSRNAPSMRAIEKLGATKEGVLRRHMIMGDGVVRDTVMYSITDEQWPQVRERLSARIDE